MTVKSGSMELALLSADDVEAGARETQVSRVAKIKDCCREVKDGCIGAGIAACETFCLIAGIFGGTYGAVRLVQELTKNQ